jgi:hypothetical protein
MPTRPRFYEFLIVATSLILFMEVPPITYGLLIYKQFEFLSVSGYMPYEEVIIALRSGSISNILAAPVVSLNMTSGHLFSNVYAFTIGALAASFVLGVLTGLAIVSRLRLQSASGGGGAKAVAIAGLGLLATVGASSAGLLGCHGGSGMSGGILSAAGVSESTAGLLAWLSPYIQVALIILLTGYYFYLIHLSRKQRQQQFGFDQSRSLVPS